MKSKRLFQIFVLLVLLFSPFGGNWHASASTSLPDWPMSIQLNSSALQDTDQLPPFVYTAVDPSSLDVGETAVAAVVLNNVPAEGYTSVELTCSYDPSLLETSDIIVGDLFGVDPVIAVNDPQAGYFIVAIAGSQGNKMTSDGPVMAFHVSGLQAGQTALNCKARASGGDNQLINIYSVPAPVTILGDPLTPTVMPAVCDKADFLADITIPPGTIVSPGATFTKTWRLANVGSCTWTGSYQLVFFSGEPMDGPLSADLSMSVEPGELVDISLDLTAPSAPGSYRGSWMFRNANGVLFGVGPQGDQPWSVDIVVSGATVTSTPTLTPASTASPTPTSTQTPTQTPMEPVSTLLPNTAYDFAANVCVAIWYSGAGQLPCPGVDGSPNGFVLKMDEPASEGMSDMRPGLLTVPQNVYNGYIQGFYPPFHVQNGDRFRAEISCEAGAQDCYVGFRLDYVIGNGSTQTLWGPFLEHLDGKTDLMDIDLSPLAGQDVKFVLTVLAVGSASGDRALWLDPLIYRLGINPTPTVERSSTPTDTPTPIDEGWWSLTNSGYGFEIAYPRRSQVVPGGTDNLTRIDLPTLTGTNLLEKYVQIVVTENLDPCRSSLPGSQSSETVIYNGTPFLRQTGVTSASGHTYKWTAYSVSRARVCVSLDFVLHSIDPGGPNIPPAQAYDEVAESAVFAEMAGRFWWPVLSTPTFTPTPNTSGLPTSTPTLVLPGTVTGRVLAGKEVVLVLYDMSHRSVTSVTAGVDGTFSLTADAGTYYILAYAHGFLSAIGPVLITAQDTSTKPTIALLAGDIDNNYMIDQFDALTIGMNYNLPYPASADLNNDGIVNVLDLELLARNYRKTGPLEWQ